ncbi:hypothetical protein [Catellatospora methionotrophica]|uniref:hypothetical protein n=1 Tax=Catellatospora methionotrophica TaxID=121620 RepID=UPI0033E47518
MLPRSRARPQRSRGIQYATSASATDSSAAKTVIVYVGGGLWRVRGHAVIDDFRVAQPSTVVVTGYEGELGNPDVWAAEAYATCAA